MKKLLRKIKRAADRLFGTESDKFYWRFRHIFQDKNWAEKYISPETLEKSRHKPLFQTITRHAPFQKVFEFGCASGPNLILLSKKFPETEFWGIDISKSAIKIGKEHVAKNKISNVHLETGSIGALKKFPDNDFDIVFTDAVLIYIGPEKVKEVLNELIRIAKKSIILVEWRNDKHHAYEADHWSYNWEMLFKELGIPKIKIVSLSDNSWQGEWAKRGCVIEISLQN